MISFQINAEAKAASGKKAAKATRNAGLIPAIIYGGGKETQIAVKHNDIKKAVFTNNLVIVEINLGGEVHKCFVKAAQFHPVTDEIIHLDFLRLLDGTPVKVNLPIEFKGTPVGVSDGGTFLPHLIKAKVKALPSKLVSTLSVDISKMKMGDSIRIVDLEAIDGIEIMESPSTPIAKVIIPRSLKSIEATIEEGTEEGAEETEKESAE